MNRVIKIWNGLEKFFVGLLSLASLICVGYAVWGRYVLRSPSDWPEEIIVYMIIGAVFISASTLADKNGHVAATLVVERLPVKVRRILALLNCLLALGFCGIVLWYGIKIVMVNMMSSQLSNTSLRFPLWVPYLSIPLGCFLMCIRYLHRIWRLIFRFEIIEIKESHELSR